MIFGLDNHGYPSHYDLHIKSFNSCELKFLIEYQYKIFLLLMVPLPDPRNDMGEVLNIECRTSIELLLIYPMAVSEASGMPILVIQSVEKEVGLFVCS